MIFKELPLRGAYIIEPEPFIDDRGIFARIFCETEFGEIGHKDRIVQVNHSITKAKGAIRGLHFQHPPKAEIKIVKCISGAVFDVIVDIRKGSPTLQDWHGETLSAKNKKMMYVPEGFAHGLQTLEENAELIYFHTEFYSPNHESGLHYKDPSINIRWPLETTEISEKDSTRDFLEPGFEGIRI